MKKGNVYDKNCPARLVLNKLSNKWTILIVGVLEVDTKRFNELMREVDGISQKMLTETLKGMERDGLLTRKIYPTIPPKVEYSLTDLGRTLTTVLHQVRDWSQENLEKILVSQSRYDETKEKEYA